MSSSISFTGGGIDVSQLVAGLMSVERQPVDRLVTKQAAVKLQSDAVGRLRNALDGLRNTASGFAPKPDGRPLTKFEARGLRLGHGVWDLVFRRA